MVAELQNTRFQIIAIRTILVDFQDRVDIGHHDVQRILAIYLSNQLREFAVLVPETDIVHI